MDQTIRRLPDSELAVMQVLWDKERPVTRPEIDEALAEEKSWTTSTIVALLARLEAKGFLTHEKQGRGYLYRARISRDEYLASESSALLESLYRGSAKNFLAALHRGGSLNEQEIDELERYLDELKRGDPT